MRLRSAFIASTLVNMVSAEEEEVRRCHVLCSKGVPQMKVPYLLVIALAYQLEICLFAFSVKRILMPTFLLWYRIHKKEMTGQHLDW